MRLHDRAANREAEAHAAGFCRNKRLKQVIDHWLSEARPAVGDGDLDSVVVD
jgi:hypothetical protein